MRSLVFAVSLFALAMSRPARADDSDATPRANATWYGYQVLAADATILAGWATFPLWRGFNADGAVLFLDILAYEAVPVIHSLHDDDVGTSIGLRLSFPFVGGLLGLAAGSMTRCTCALLACSCFDRLTWGFFDGAVIGAGIASIIDAVAFSWARRKPSDSRATTSWSVAPFGLPGGGGLGASCVF